MIFYLFLFSIITIRKWISFSLFLLRNEKIFAISKKKKFLPKHFQIQFTKSCDCVRYRLLCNWMKRLFILCMFLRTLNSIQPDSVVWLINETVKQIPCFVFCEQNRNICRQKEKRSNLLLLQTKISILRIFNTIRWCAVWPVIHIGKCKFCMCAIEEKPVYYNRRYLTIFFVKNQMPLNCIVCK